MPRHLQRSLAAVLVVALALGVARSDRRGVPVPSVEKRWSIGIYTGATPLDLAPGPSEPVLTADEVTDVSARFVADPFLVRDGAKWHLFFEVFNAATSQGDIGWAASDDARHWIYQRIVLDEPFHLSYPYVFRDGDAYYMVPESHEAGAIRLYRGDPFPSRWTLVKNLIGGSALDDPSVVYYGGRWWLFAGWGYDDSLRVFFADRPDGPWTPHAANPVVSHARDRARPGGRVLIWEDRLIRFAQDDSTTYGAAVSAYEITQLTPDRYSERPAARVPLLAAGRGWSAAGMHHVDPVRVAPGDWIAAVDGSQRRLVFGWRRVRLWPSWGAR